MRVVVVGGGIELAELFFGPGVVAKGPVELPPGTEKLGLGVGAGDELKLPLGEIVGELDGKDETGGGGEVDGDDGELLALFKAGWPGQAGTSRG